MAWSFRRRVKVGGMNLNLSRSGLGMSAGAVENGHGSVSGVELGISV
jgi:hypothetical protein